VFTFIKHDYKQLMYCIFSINLISQMCGCLAQLRPDLPALHLTVLRLRQIVHKEDSSADVERRTYAGYPVSALPFYFRRSTLAGTENVCLITSQHGKWQGGNELI